MYCWREFSMNRRKSPTSLFKISSYPTLKLLINYLEFIAELDPDSQDRGIDIDTREAMRVRINGEFSTFQVNSEKRAARC